MDGDDYMEGSLYRETVSFLFRKLRSPSIVWIFLFDLTRCVPHWRLWFSVSWDIVSLISVLKVFLYDVSFKETVTSIWEMTWIKVSPPKTGKWNRPGSVSSPPPAPPTPPSCEDRRRCRGVSVKSYGSFEHIAHSGGKNDPDDKRASCKIQAFVAFRNWIKFGTFIYLTDTLRRSQRLRIWFKSRGVKLYSDFRRLVTLNEIEQRWMPWSLIHETLLRTLYKSPFTYIIFAVANVPLDELIYPRYVGLKIQCLRVCLRR